MTNVREHNGSLRWRVVARDDEPVGEAIVTVDTTRGGHVLGIQGGGDDEADAAALECIGDVLAIRQTLRELDYIDRPRRRSDRLRWAA